MIAKRGREATASSCCGRGWRTSRGSSAPTSSARRDRRRPLRRRPDQPLLPRPHPQGRRPTSPSRPPGPTRTARARTPTSPASGSSRARSNAPTAVALMEFLTVPARAGGDRRGQRVRGEPGRAAAPQHIASWADVKLDPIDVRARRPAAGRRRRADASRSGGTSRGTRTRATPRRAAAAGSSPARSSRCSSPARCSRCPRASSARSARSTRSPRAAARGAARAASCSRVGVAAGTLLLGGALAALVSFYDFPGRRWLDWALVLPLAMPVVRARVRAARPVRRGQPAADAACATVWAAGLPEIRPRPARSRS